MNKRAFIVCTAEGDAIIQNGKVKCKSEDGLKEFAVESDLLENATIEPFQITIDGTVYSIPTDEYIPVDEPQTSRPDPKQCSQARHLERACYRYGSQRWSVPATRKFINLVRECGEDNGQYVFITKREKLRHIARQMTRNGYRMDEFQAENRLKSLHRAYRNFKGKELATRKASIMRHCERELHALFANKRSNTARLLIEEHLEEQPADTESNEEPDTNDLEEDYLEEEESAISNYGEKAFDATIPSAATCQSLLSTLDEMDDVIYTLGQKIDEESWATEELLHDVRRLVAASGLIRKKLTEGAAAGESQQQ
uniref:Myb/SANT-like DNA-binding domain-containing protein n=1 Tax=Anopheles atroparvus TaxID=41427 RepID=A0A182J779_ANOAO